MHKHFASGPHMSMNISSVSKFGKTPLTHLCNAWTLPKVIKKEIENYRKDYFENTFNDTEDSNNALWTAWNREEPCTHSYNTQKEIHLKLFRSLQKWQKTSMNLFSIRLRNWQQIPEQRRIANKWKPQLVKTQHKKKEKTSFENYRPVSNLVEVGKFAVYAVAEQIIEHFIENNFSHSNHHGGLPNRSITTALIQLFDM